MTLTPEQARERAQSELAASWWGKRDGTFFVADVELSDATDYCISAGAREWFVDVDARFVSIDDTFHWMNKETGELRRASMSNDDDIAKLEGMTDLAFDDEEESDEIE